MTAGSTEKKPSTLGEWVDNIAKIVEGSSKIASAFYLYFVVTGLGESISKDYYLLIAPLFLLVLLSFALLGIRAISPKPLTEKVRWLRSITGKRPFWIVLLVLYVAFAGCGFWRWYDWQKNQPPVIDLLRAQITLLSPGEQTILRVWARDPEKGILKYRWEITDGGGTVDSESDTSPQAIYTAPMPTGRKTIIVTVIDDKRKQASEPTFVDVR